MIEVQRRLFDARAVAYLRETWSIGGPLARACSRLDLERGEVYGYVPDWPSDEQLLQFAAGYAPGPTFSGQTAVAQDIDAMLRADERGVVLAEDLTDPLAGALSVVEQTGIPVVGTPDVAAAYAEPGAPLETLIEVLRGPMQYTGGIVVVSSRVEPLHLGAQLTEPTIDQLARDARMLISEAWDGEDYLVWRAPT
jgi:hypothetical protein